MASSSRFQRSRLSAFSRRRRFRVSVVAIGLGFLLGFCSVFIGLFSNNRVALNLFPLTASPTDRRKRALRSLAELKDEEDRSIQLSLSAPPPPNEPLLPAYEPAFPQTLILIQSNQPGSLYTYSAKFLDVLRGVYTQGTVLSFLIVSFLVRTHPISTKPRAFRNFLGKAVSGNEQLRVVRKIYSVMDWAMSWLPGASENSAANENDIQLILNEFEKLIWGLQRISLSNIPVPSFDSSAIDNNLKNFKLQLELLSKQVNKLPIACREETFDTIQDDSKAFLLEKIWCLKW